MSAATHDEMAATLALATGHECNQGDGIAQAAQYGFDPPSTAMELATASGEIPPGPGFATNVFDASGAAKGY